MSYQYVVLGSGRQGTAAAFDLAKFGQASRILMADASREVASRAVERINSLIGHDVAETVQLDVTDTDRLMHVLDGADVVLSAVPYYFNLEITKACIKMGASLCDMGGNTEVVWAQLEFDEAARQAGVSVVPDCGMGPGLINTMGVYVIDLLDTPREVYLYDAGLPKEPTPPWNYLCTFHLNGLTNEYDGEATFIRDGKITMVPTFTEVEMVDFPPLGQLEAFVISGSMSTTADSHLGKLQRYENKVLRYPGHYQTFEAYKRLGLFSEEPVQIDGHEVVPRDFYHQLLDGKITTDEVEDVCVMRAIGIGEKDGRQAKVVVNLLDGFDPKTGFTGMERLTGWHCAIMMEFQAAGKIGPGAHRMEQAVSASDVMEAVCQRGIEFSVNWE
ncbi:MAG: saccharopine dehydrogenase NADP-binding domain-containing protein [Anaerolineales bacterium]|nr:saccharopine dehydrogenase NADP-binding domain-containing protein [Anaerolineales bacterium]